MPGKVCTKCKVWKPEQDFYRVPPESETLHSWCKACCKLDRDSRRREPDPNVMEKECSDCGEVKPIAEFHKNILGHDGYRNNCKWCRVSVRYMVPAEWYNKTFADQGGMCAICGEVGDLVVDHDHACCDRVGSCGICVRGLICQPCNKGLGGFRDNPRNLARAIDYLAEHEPWTGVD